MKLTTKTAFTLAESPQRGPVIACLTRDLPLWKCVKAQVAFTLAETLIALAVIGIVAALTIPGIVKNYNEHAWSTAQDVFSRKLDVALKEMNTEGTLTGYRTTEDFVNELKKNIKITKVCTGSQITNCFADKVVWSQWDEPVEVNESNLKYNPMYGYDWAETVGVQFSNGINALIGYNKNCASDPYNNQYSPSASCIGIIYDVSGFKKPNSNGKDITSNGNLTLGCAFKFSYGGESVCFTKVLAPGQYQAFPMEIDGQTVTCTQALEKGYIVSAYYTSCYYGNSSSDSPDYWAGAQYACGGSTFKMASRAQLTLLAKYLYETDDINDTGYTSTSSHSSAFNANVAKTPFGDYYSSNSYFIVWAGAEYPRYGDGAYYRDFDSSGTSFNGLTRNLGNAFAVCVE